MWRLLSFLAVACVTLACGDDTQTATPASGGSNSGGSSSSSGGSGGSGGGIVDGCGTGALAAGDHTFTITHGDIERSYNLHLPPSYDDATALPLVLNFHGFGSDASEQQLFSGMNAVADREGFAVAYPQGIESSFNGGSACCGVASSQGIDDVGFARAIVADVAARGCLDSKRVYATGMSNGGFMSHRLACEASDVFAAVAPVDGLLGIPPSSCTPARNLPIIHFYGTADPLVDYQYAILTNDHWVSTYNCVDSAPEVTYMQGMAQCETWDECDGGATVTFCSITDMGHCWPGQSFCPPSLGASNVDISANDEMWALFSQHQLP